MPIRLYVGDLGDRGKRSEIEREFNQYGHVTEVWVARNPPGFAFVFMDSNREAEDAVRNLDGANMCGVRVKVEFARGPEKGEKPRSGPKCYECGRVGHAARDCTRRHGYVYHDRGPPPERGQSRSRDRFYSRDRSRSYERPERRRSRSRSRSRGNRRYDARNKRD